MTSPIRSGFASAARPTPPAPRGRADQRRGRRDHRAGEERVRRRRRESPRLPEPSGDRWEIGVNDDGSGMDLETVLGVWMDPGVPRRPGARRYPRRAANAGGKRRRPVRGGQAGEVPRARLADRMARGGPGRFDWDQFDRGTGCSRTSGAAGRLVRPAGIDPHGTILTISRAPLPMDGADVPASVRATGTPPCSRSPDETDFVIRIESDEFPHYSGETRSETPRPCTLPHRRDVRRRHAPFESPGTVRHRSGPLERCRGPSAVVPCGCALFAYDLETDALARVGPRHGGPRVAPGVVGDQRVPGRLPGLALRRASR